MCDKSINFWGRADDPTTEPAPLQCSEPKCQGVVHGMIDEGREPWMTDQYCDACLIRNAEDCGDWSDDALAAAERAGIDKLKLIEA